MPKAVLICQINSTYNDRPEERYHFSSEYLGRMEAAVGDAVVFYEPHRSNGGRGPRRGKKNYFATGLLTGIEPDKNQSGLYYGRIREYLDFTDPVPLRSPTGQTYERRLQLPNGNINNGAAINAVRHLDDDEFELIVGLGFSSAEEQERKEHESTNPFELSEPPASFKHRVIEQVVRRPFRERAFATRVRSIYGSTCAMTGIKLVNGGDRAEMEAAHIRPVENDGPDTVRNGIALSRTFHWMFDRGFLSIADDFKILVADRHVDPVLMRLLPADRTLRVPADPASQPHKQYLEYHRDEKFKG